MQHADRRTDGDRCEDGEHGSGANSCTRPSTMPSRASSEPTDRSMLREMIENVSGTATSASAADWEIIVWTRLRLTQTGLRTANVQNRRP